MNRHRPHPSPAAHQPAELDGITTGFLRVDGVAVHVGSVDGTAGHADANPTPGAIAAAAEDPTVGVLLLHHFYGNVATWRRVLRRLDERGIPAVAVDRPGFGWTQRPSPAHVDEIVLDGTPNPYTRAFAVAAARAVVEDRGWDEVVVVGSSMGGTLAIELAAGLEAGDDGAAVRHLVLLAPALTGDVGMPPPLRPLLRSGVVRRAMRPVINRLSRRMDLDRVAGGWHDQALADQSDIDAYRIPTTLPGWADGIWQVMTVEAPPNLREVAAALQVPTTVVSGNHDRTIRPRWNRRTAAGMDAELVEVDAGHTPQEEAPDVVVDVVVDVLAGPGRTAVGSSTGDRAD